MSTIPDDASAAAVAYIMEHWRGLPADEGRIAVWLRDVIRAAVEAGILKDRQRRPVKLRQPRPSKN
jgi:hypothetical protein